MEPSFIICNTTCNTMTLNVGDKAPDFELVDTELKMRTLQEFRGKKVVLAFFVAASSPVCEKEMCTFRDSWDELSNMNAQVIGISNDGPFANKAFAAEHKLTFPVLGDYTSKTIRDYDILMPDLLHVKGYNAAKRSVFIVDEEGTVTYRWVSDSPLKEPNYNEITSHLQK